MIIVKETEKLKIYWHDNNKTILIFDVLLDITWDETIPEAKFINDTLKIEAANHPVYSIADMTQTQLFVPKGGNPVKNLYDLMQIDPGYEELVIFILPINLLSPLMKIGINFYGLLPIIHKYRFVKTKEEALDLVHQHMLESSYK